MQSRFDFNYIHIHPVGTAQSPGPPIEIFNFLERQNFPTIYLNIQERCYTTKMMSNDDVIRAYFALDAADAIPPLTDLSLTFYTVCSSETWDTILATAAVLGRDTVTGEMGGNFHGPVAQRLSKALLVHCKDEPDSYKREAIQFENFLVEASYSVPLDADIIEQMRKAMDDKDKVPEFFFTPKDTETKEEVVPVVVARKGEESSVCPYGDVAFSWPKADPVAERKASGERARRQLEINAEVFGISPTQLKREMEEVVEELVALSSKKSKVK